MYIYVFEVSHHIIDKAPHFYNNQHLIFTSYEDCIIRSADVYAENSNTITFELRDNNGAVLDDTTHVVNPGKQNIILNFNVPSLSDLQLGISTNNSGLYRNSTGSTYPYDIGGMINITGSSASQSGYYYFYYNIEVEAQCLDVSSSSYADTSIDRNLLKVTDMLGREVSIKQNIPLFYMYSDGTVEKKIIIE